MQALIEKLGVGLEDDIAGVDAISVSWTTHLCLKPYPIPELFPFGT